MVRFEFATAQRILFGAGTLGEVGPAAAQCGRHALVVIGRNADRAQPLLRLLATARIQCTVVAVPGEPTTHLVESATATARAGACDLVVGMGGGSALDAAKAIAGLATNPGPILDYLEVVGRGRALEAPALPWIALPTTAGTGTEVTRNAVLTVPEHRVKVSLRSPFLLARLAIIDPELTYDLPPRLTASTGMDALTQLIEPFVCRRTQPMVDALCRDGIARVARALPRAFLDGRDPRAREDMAQGSFFGGLALANAGLGAVHGFAAPLGGMFTAPHGAVCAALLAPVMRVNLRALRSRDPGNPALERYTEVAQLLTGNAAATADQGVDAVADLTARLAIPRLSERGVDRMRLAEIVAKASQASSMKANPISLTADELTEILEAAL